MGLLDFIGDIFGTASNNRNVDRTNDANMWMNSQNIEYQRATNEQNIALQREVNAQNERMARESYDRQEQAARNSIQWRVADAKASGVHPLYAMGASGVSIAPAYVGASAPSLTAPQHGFGRSESSSGLSGMGQHIGRAVQSMMSKGERDRQAMLDFNAYQMEMAEKSARIQLLESERALNDRTQIGPPAPVSEAVPEFGPMGGGVNDKRVSPVPASPVINSRHDNSREAGNVTDRSYTRTAQGYLAPVMSIDANQRLQEDFPGTVMWNVRNRLQPFFTKNNVVPSVKEFPLPKGQRWGYDRWQGVYRPYYTSNKQWVR